MLKKITLCKTSCYGDTPQHLETLQKINIIYGENGAGKSTIARLIQDSAHPDFCESCIEWENNTPIKTLIYNKQFIDETLKETEIPGIFTLGKEAVDIINTIAVKKAEKNSLETKLARLSQNHQEKTSYIETETGLFQDQCWRIKKKYDDSFSHAFAKLNKSKLNFYLRCIEAVSSAVEHNYDELEKEATFLFVEDTPRIDLIPELDTKDLHDTEKSPIFKQKIIGKEDINISKLITKLGNSDWVQQGIKFLSSPQCPFCQQTAPADLRQQLEEYFDDTYQQQISELQEKSRHYATYVKSIIEHTTNLLNLKHDLFKPHNMHTEINSIKDKYRKNISSIDFKSKEPSKEIAIESIEAEISNIQKIIAEINVRIKGHNERLNNINEERKLLTIKIWQFIGHEAAQLYNDFLTRISPAKNAIVSIDSTIKTKTSMLSKTTAEILHLEQQIVSITPSKDGINTILKSYGFDNFRIVDNEDGNYQIKRSDGSCAHKTLSEGERTFITFLYFYQTIKGSITKGDIESPRLIIFDDPVSSLDSKVLFVVSSLIRSLFSKGEMERLNIKQIFLLTHNVYFHKEVSYLSNIKHLGNPPLSKNDFSFWIIRRKNGASTPIHFPENPIKTNYHLLWQELKRNITEETNSISTCNTMRRILENYFKTFGGHDFHDLANKFDGEEKIVIQSLISWTNDGSHFAHECIDIGIGDDLSDHYMPIFRKIFDKMGHLPHYDMMMNSC